jgi:RNA polymerase sigma-70 factor (ECF subfamily)
MSKAVFNLYAIDGYKHEEIGELLNISTNTSKVHYFRAKQKLQVLLSKQKSLL